MKDFNIQIESIEFWGDNGRNKGGIEIVWFSPKGYGTFQYALHEDNNGYTLMVDDEYMGEEFAKAVLEKAIMYNMKCD